MIAMTDDEQVIADFQLDVARHVRAAERLEKDAAHHRKMADRASAAIVQIRNNPRVMLQDDGSRVLIHRLLNGEKAAEDEARAMLYGRA